MKIDLQKHLMLLIILNYVYCKKPLRFFNKIKHNDNHWFLTI